MAGPLADRVGERGSETLQQPVISAGVVGVELGERDRDQTGARGEDPQRSEHVAELQPCVAGGVLGQRSIGEVDDVDVEMDRITVRALRDELQRPTGGRLRFDLTSSNATRATPSRSIAPRSNLVECDISWPNSTT